MKAKAASPEKKKAPAKGKKVSHTIPENPDAPADQAAGDAPKEEVPKKRKAPVKKGKAAEATPAPAKADETAAPAAAEEKKEEAAAAPAADAGPKKPTKKDQLKAKLAEKLAAKAERTNALSGAKKDDDKPKPGIAKKTGIVGKKALDKTAETASPTKSVATASTTPVKADDSSTGGGLLKKGNSLMKKGPLIKSVSGIRGLGGGGALGKKI